MVETRILYVSPTAVPTELPKGISDSITLALLDGVEYADWAIKYEGANLQILLWLHATGQYDERTEAYCNYFPLHPSLVPGESPQESYDRMQEFLEIFADRPIVDIGRFYKSSTIVETTQLGVFASWLYREHNGLI